MLKFCTPFLLTTVYESVLRVFLFCLINLVSVNLQKPGLFSLANNSRSKQNKTNLKDPFKHIGKQETCAKFQNNVLNSVVVFRQNTWFLKKNYNLVYIFVLDFALLNKYYQNIKKPAHVSQFYINHLSHLNVGLVFSQIALSPVEGSLKILRTVEWGIENSRIQQDYFQY